MARGQHPSFLLLYPPIAEPYAPYLGLPELSAVLKSQGYICQCIDLNVRAHEELLTADNLHGVLESALSKASRSVYRCSLNQSFDERQHRRFLLAVGQHLVEHIEEAKSRLREKSIYRFDASGNPVSDRYFHVFSRAREVLFSSPLIHRYLSHTSQTHFLCRKDITTALETYDESLYAPFLHEQLSKSVARKPCIVGINITFAEQVIPGILTAVEVRRLWPQAVILLGGAYPTTMRSSLSEFPDLLKVVDGIVCGDGEPVLLGIGQNIRGGLPWYNRISAVMHRNGDRLCKPELVDFWDIRASPPPDFDDFIDERYFAAYSQLAYATTRGCYWGKCRFCDYPASHPRFGAKSLEQITCDLEWLIKRYGVRSFHLTDDAISPQRVLAIARAIQTAGIRMNWWCLSRFDSHNGVVWSEREIADIAAAGCYKVFFGGESAVSHVQEKCEKGFGLDLLKASVERLRGGPLRIHVSFVVGMPGESLADARVTADWAAKIAENPHFTTRLHVFRLCRHSPMAMHDSTIEWFDNELTDLAIDIANYREKPRTYEEQRRHNATVSLVKAQFLRQYTSSATRRYPEYHNCAGLQYHLGMNSDANRAHNGSGNEREAPRLFRLAPPVAFAVVEAERPDGFGGDTTPTHHNHHEDQHFESQSIVLYDLNEDRYLVLKAVLQGWVEAVASASGTEDGLPNDLSAQDRKDLISALIGDGWIELVRS